MKVTVLSERSQAAAMNEVMSAMEDDGTLFIAMTVESRIVVLHRGIQPAGVDGRHPVRMMRLLSGWRLRERPRVGWVPFIGRVMSVECLNGFVERKKSLGAKEVVWQTTGGTYTVCEG